MIIYKGKPLLGEDSSVSNTSEFFAIAGTILFWLIFLIFSFVIKPQPKKQYKEVQIVLSSTPVVQKTEEAPAPAEAASASAASSEPVVEKVVETPPAPAPKAEPAPKKAETPKPKAQTQPKKETAKSTTTQKPAEPVTYAKSVEELMAEQFSSKSSENKMKNFDDMFDDNDSEESSTTTQNKTVQNNAPAFTGSAGTAAATDNAKVTSSSSSNTSNSQTVSASTSNALQGIKNSTFKGNAANGVQSETSVKTKTSGSGKVEMAMSNGRSRALLYPEKPVINLSAPAAATIDASITVSISFRVNEKGNVSGIIISPSAAFKDVVKHEITEQLLEWIFEPADYTATATFEYTIIKR